MALLPDNAPTRQTEEQILARFGIAQDGKPTEAQLREQALLREQYAALAVRINQNVADGPEKEQALAELEDALMWTGKAIFK